MNNPQKTPGNKEEKDQVEKSKKFIGRGVISNFLFTYGTLPLNMIITFAFGRNFSRAYWDILTYAFVLTQSAQIILMFIPPSIGNYLIVRVPEHLLKGEYSVVKGIVRYIFLLKIVTSSITCIIFSIIGISLSQSEDTRLIGVSLVIYAPFIILEEIRKIYMYLFQAMKNFMLRVYLLVIQQGVMLIGSFIVFYAFNLSPETELYLVTALHIVSLLPSVLVNFFLFYKKFKKFTPVRIKLREIKDSVKYGLNFTIISSLNLTSNQIYNGILKGSGTDTLVNQYKLANNLVSQSQRAFTVPLTPIFIDLYLSNNEKAMYRLFKKSVYFTNILLALLIGLIFYLSEVYVLVIYPPEFMVLVPTLRIYILTAYFQNWISNYSSIYSTIHTEKRMVIINIISFAFTVLLVIVTYLFWGISGMLISICLGKAVHILLFWADGKYLIKSINLSLWDLFQNLIMVLFLFLVNFLLFRLIQWIIPLDFFINIAQKLLNFISVDLQTQLSILVQNGIQLFTFLLLFAGYIIFFKAITKNDIQALENAKMKIPFKKLLVKILRDERPSDFILPV